MAVTRREFVKAGTAAAVAAAACSLDTAQAAGRALSVDAGVHRGMTEAAFRAQLDTPFRVHDASGARSTFVLAEVQDLATPHQKQCAAPGQECFSLSFKAPACCTMTQGTHRVEHPVFGAFDLFVVPGRPEKTHTPYVAVFNHLVPAMTRIGPPLA